MNKQKDLEALRHSAEHVLHTAMQKLYPNLRKVMGPSIETGFYMDFDLEGQSISPDDFPKIEAEMQKIIDARLPITGKEITTKDAVELFMDNQYKLNTIKEIEEAGENPEVYEIGTPKDEYYDIDLCKGPHVKNTKEIKAFKLLSVAGAYYKGDENNKMLQRIYGTAFPTAKELKEHLKNLEEAEKYNHRKLGKQLGLFAIVPEIGKGLPVWLPNGYAMRRELEDYMLKLERKHGYKHILTPHISKEILFKTSGHLDFFKESMYAPMKIEDESYYLKPMNCPAGMMVYKLGIKSYRDLPLKLGEFGTVYRYEKSGELHGLQRVRGFTQNDAHIFCTPEQLQKELEEVIELLHTFYKDVGFEKYRFRLSLSDPKAEKYTFCGSREGWEQAEKELESVLQKHGLEYERAVGEATFYGPKIDVQAINVYGKEDSISTIQIDFNLPERFDIYYIDEKGNKARPFVIHRALIGSFERFFAFLIEHYKGAFPLWLSPIQAQVIPISDKNNEYAQEIAEKLMEKDLRVEADISDNTMQAKIREAQMQKIPYMLIVGDKEEKNQSVSVRLRSGENKGSLPIKEFTDILIQKYLTKDLQLW